MPAQNLDKAFADSVISDAQHDALRHHESAELSRLWQRFAGVRIFFALLLAGLILFTGNSSSWLLVCLLAYSAWLLWNFTRLRRETSAVHLPIDRLSHPGWRSVEVDLLFCSAILWIPPLLQYAAGNPLAHLSLTGLGSLPPLWPLLLFGVVQAGIFGTRRIAAVTAALATLSLFIAHWIGSQILTTNLRSGLSAIQNWFPLAEGLAGLICFAVGLLAHLLADRLRTYELRSARAKQQLHWQELMTDTLLTHNKVGVVVVTRDLTLLACNSAALELLGLFAPPTLSSAKVVDAPPTEDNTLSKKTQAASQPELEDDPALEDNLQAWRHQLHAPAFSALTQLIPEPVLGIQGTTPAIVGASTIELMAPSGRLVQMVYATPQTVNNYPFIEPCFTFTMQDLEAVKQRVQQEKLISIGRLSAAVAHEIRNPLAAMTTANALLAEQLQTASVSFEHSDALGLKHSLKQWEQLNGMVAKNAARLERTVRDILEGVHVEYPKEFESAAPVVSNYNAGALEIAEPIEDLAAWLQTEFDEWLLQNSEAAMNDGAQLQRYKLRISPQAQQAVSFDAEHLRRVLVNLLNNAARLSSHEPEAIILSAGLKKSTQQLALTVWSHSPPMPDHIKQHLFEPLLSTSPQSSGLGLYLSYQLCQRYGAVLSHREHTRHRTAPMGETLVGAALIGESLVGETAASSTVSRVGNEFAVVFAPSVA